LRRLNIKSSLANTVGQVFSKILIKGKMSPKCSKNIKFTKNGIDAQAYLEESNLFGNCSPLKIISKPGHGGGHL
jgi:hypothetical protein